MDDRLPAFLREQLRRAGRHYERTRRAYSEGREEPPADEDAPVDRPAGESDPADRRDSESDPAVDVPIDRVDVPTDETGRARLVCRRYAERRAVDLDEEGRPACFRAEHPDCVGCFEDVRAGCIETW